MEEIWILGMRVAAKGVREKGEKFESKREKAKNCNLKPRFLK
jgi:hypothetical protein